HDYAGGQCPLHCYGHPAGKRSRRRHRVLDLRQWRERHRRRAGLFGCFLLGGNDSPRCSWHVHLQGVGSARAGLRDRHGELRHVHHHGRHDRPTHQHQHHHCPTHRHQHHHRPTHRHQHHHRPTHQHRHQHHHRPTHQHRHQHHPRPPHHNRPQHPPSPPPPHRPQH